MAFEYPDSLPAASRLMQEFVAAELANLPDFTKEKVIEAMSELSMADQLVKFGEAIYANAANVNAAARNAGAAIIGFASGFTGYGPYHGLQVDNRGGRIVAALRRRNGHTSPNPDGWPAAATDPAPLSNLVEEPPVLPPAPPSEPEA